MLNTIDQRVSYTETALITRDEVREALIQKADIEDVSRAVTEVLNKVDHKMDIEDLRKQMVLKVDKKE